MKNLKQVLMERDGLTADAADQQIRDARTELNAAIADGETPFDFMEDTFGLEPDYLEELLG